MSVTPYSGPLSLPQLPDPLIAEAYEQAARRNVLAALNPAIFFGYFSVCADGCGHGNDTTFPGLDWGQSAEALLWLGRTAEARASWDYVRKFMRSDGLLPFAILPSLAGRTVQVGHHAMTIEPNGALFVHWVPGNPLRTLANVTFIQMADAIVRHTQDLAWLSEQYPWIRRAVEWLARQVNRDGLVGGAGYYLERPTRIEFDGVNQCCTAQALHLAARLMKVLGDSETEQRCRELAGRITAGFQARFWAGDQFIEYIHPQRGAIQCHGLSDVDWAALATGTASDEQAAALWPHLVRNPDFSYDGMPGGIATRPEAYEDWEMQGLDPHDLAAMGRVWFLEAHARARMGDAEGLLDSLLCVARRGRADGWHWRERYYSEKTGELAPSPMNTYVEYAATLIRIVQSCVLRVGIGVDGSLTLAPCVVPSWWDAGFGQRLRWGGRELTYQFRQADLTGSYRGTTALRLYVRFPGAASRRVFDLPASESAVEFAFRDSDGTSLTAA